MGWNGWDEPEDEDTPERDDWDTIDYEDIEVDDRHIYHLPEHMQNYDY
jgi:hypothetical protein